MTAFYDGKYDVLLSTAIVESGLDIPNANTLIVHRADMFGLAQLYQLRGRVGRSKTRAYAYFTTPANQRLTEGAEKRLKVLQSLDTLGAGFSLASHDMDIRGAGNLLGEEQSGHIHEVGFELYQSMLEEAVAALKGGDLGETQEQWSPQISLGTAVLIPESYVSDLQLRLGLYRRLSTLEKRADIDGFAAELVDRFGELPEEVKHLLDVVEIKGLARQAGLQQVDAGPKGAVIAFRKNQFANPAGLVAFMQKSAGRVKLQPDHKLVFRADWPLPEERLRGVRALVRQLADVAGAGQEGGVGWGFPLPVLQERGEGEVRGTPMTDLDAVRSWYAEELRYAAAVKSPAVVRAFATVPRERFLGPGPWLICTGEAPNKYWSTEDARSALRLPQRRHRHADGEGAQQRPARLLGVSSRPARSGAGQARAAPGVRCRLLQRRSSPRSSGPRAA